MLRKLIQPFLLVVLIPSATSAWAAVQRETFEVSVTIPSASFYVLPVDPELVLREQRLPFDLRTSELRPLRALFDVKNINGSIEARLLQAAYLFNGRDRIDLRVRFNDVELSGFGAEVVSADAARPGQRVNLEISAVKPSGGYLPGDYFGTVHMVFDAIPPLSSMGGGQ